MKKLTSLLAVFLICSTVFATITPSGELFATYQKQGDRFYKGGGEADLSADYFDWNVNYYIVACGDSMLLRVTTTEDRNLNPGWQTQLRVWNASGTYETQRCEIQVDEGDAKNRYTAIGKNILAKTADNLNIHVFLDWEGFCTTETFGFNRAAINNPIEDAVAPAIVPEDITMTEEGDKLVFTFGEVTATDPYFLYVGDKDHGVGGISLTNKVYITKPTVQDGITYTFKCYAVDYNGNKSASKDFTLTMPFDPAVNLALNKHCEAGAVQNDNVASKAVDGDASTFWTCFGQGDENAWWKVDLGAIYTVTKINISFNDLWAKSFSIYASQDNSQWMAVAENETSDSNESETLSNLTNINARYLKATSPQHQFGIKEFEIYASGVYVPTTPTEIINIGIDPNAQKIIENGQLIIIKNGIRYNVAGQMVK